MLEEQLLQNPSKAAKRLLSQLSGVYLRHP